jgi:hypothetical protein
VIPDADGALNVGELLRDGVRFTTAEAVAIVHGTCAQVSNGAARAMPRQPEDVWITDAGTLLIKGATISEGPRAAVASLLERLLPQSSDESVYAVPNSLRTLPARLRESGDAAKNDVTDLLLILSRYVPSNPGDVLAKLVGRLQGSTTSDEPDSPASTNVDGDIADLPLQLDAGSRPPAARQVANSNHSLLIAMSLLLITVSGFIGYHLTSDAVTPAPVAATTEAPPVVPEEPRIVERGRFGTTASEQRRPTPLILPVANGAFSPSFAANGTMLFHAGHNSSGQLFTTIVDPQGRAAAAQPLLIDRARNYHPRSSPDGTRLAFDSDRDGERAVYIADRNGERVTRVSGQGYAAVPSWSPDGTLLAFIKAEPDRVRVWNLWSLNVATGELQRHTSFRNGQTWGASWFPDGRRLAYSHEDRLIVLDLQSGAEKIHESPVKGRLVRTPAVSPDGRSIIFQVYRDGVWMLDVATGATRRVLDDVTAEEFAWAPDGQRIAYHSRRDGQWRIWLMFA